jgi:hypothetical protein
MLHEINPCIVRIIINENDIILVATLETKGAGPHTSECTRAKG